MDASTRPFTRKGRSLWALAKDDDMKRLLQVKSTIHAERLTGEVIPIQDKITHGTSYLLRCADTTKRDTRHNRFLGFLWNPLVHLGGYKAGADRIDGHVRTSQLQGCCFGKTDDASLGCCIVGLAEVTHLANHGTDVDDLAALLLHKVGQRCFHCVEIAVQVSLNDRVPVFHGEVFHRAIDVDTGIVDKYIDATKLVDGLFDEFGRLRRVRHVGLDSDSLRSPVVQESSYQVIRCFLTASIVDRHPGSALSQFFRYRTSD